ncbi:MAG: hypothetical protein ISS25_02900 [Nanoarchaeota archaeon]|nr:hypothetical protein [DPANN group archaeon]MBL7116749.1 hypothetical protein [Nanoarchaeota archaeon]
MSHTYESINPEEKGLKVKLNIFYEFPDTDNNMQKSDFMILVDKDKFEEIKPELPDVGNEIPIIYNWKKSKVVNVFIPPLREYI